MKLKRFVGLGFACIISLTNINFSVIAADNRPSRENAQAYNYDNWIQLRTGITDGEETMYAAKQIVANYAYEYMRTDYESPPRIIVDLLQKEAGFTTSVDTYIGLTDELFKDEEAKTNYYYEVLKELITNDDFNNSSINTVENTYKSKIQTAIDNKIDAGSITLQALKSLNTSKGILSDLGISDEVFKDLKGLDKFIIGCDSLKSFSDKMSTLVALTENIDNKRTFLRKIQENNSEKTALKNAVNKLLDEINTAESKSITQYFEKSDKETYNTLKTTFNDKMTELGLDAVGYGAWKNSVDWTGFAMNSLFGVDKICEIYLKMSACAEIEEILKKEIETDISKFKSDTSVANAENVIAEADYYKALELYACDLAVEYANAVKSGGVISAFDNIGNFDIKEFRETAERIKKMISNESFTDNEFKDLDTVISAMYKDDTTPDKWAVSYVKEAREKELFDIEYGYTHSITRAEFCRLICFLLESKGYNINTLIKEKNGRLMYTPFGDTRYKYVDNVHRLGIINGLGDNTFNPLGNITRQEAAVILKKTAEILGYNITTETCNDNAVADWARESVEYCLANGIMYGKSDKRFAPKDNITKQEAITTILWLYENKGKRYNSNNYDNLTNFNKYVGYWASDDVDWYIGEEIPITLYMIKIDDIADGFISGTFERNSTHFRDSGITYKFKKIPIVNNEFWINVTEKWNSPMSDENPTGIYEENVSYSIIFNGDYIYIKSLNSNIIDNEIKKLIKYRESDFYNIQRIKKDF